MTKKPGDLVKIKAKGKVVVLEDGKYTIELNDMDDVTETEITRLEEKDGILDNDDMAFLFGSDE